jgi:hypothetical protein
MLDTDMTDTLSDAAVLDESPLAPFVTMATPTRDETATLAMADFNTDGSATRALTDTDMFHGSSNTTCLDAGNKLPAAVLQTGNQSPAMSLNIDAATADAHLCVVRATWTNAVPITINEKC